MMKICPTCNKEFETRYNNRIYCSKGCYPSRVITTFSEQRTCISCGVQFTASSRAQTLCNPHCRTDRLKQREQVWPSIREFVFERDNYTCQDCGSMLLEFSLEVHHIKPVYKGGSDEESNLLSLCRECHKIRHGMSRKGD